MLNPVIPVSPIRSSDTGTPPNSPATPGRPALPSLGDLAEQVGLARLAVDLGYPVAAGDILGGVHRALRDLAVAQ
jgi:hypothetical protein